MIEYIKGELTEITPATAVVEAHGVGYMLNISLNTYTAICGGVASQGIGGANGASQDIGGANGASQDIGGANGASHGIGGANGASQGIGGANGSRKVVKLYVHEAIMTGGRDDSYTLYGFYNKQERELYRMLITVSGVGSNTARMILSATSATELVNIISSGNEKALKGVKGIGLKTAQRIIVDLRDKMAASGIIADLTQVSPVAKGPAVNIEVRDEAVGALTMLGFAPAPSHKVVTDILQGNPDMAVEQVIKQALKMIK